MQTLEQVMRLGAVGGEPLPSVYKTLAQAGVKIRRGQVTLVAGEPNAGKSLWALDHAIKAGVPCIYFSADADQFTMVLRSAAQLTGSDQKDIERAFGEGGTGAAYYEDQLSELTHLQFVFDPDPTLDDIALEIEAFEEMWGEEPALIVIDNLWNLTDDDGDEWHGMRTMVKQFNVIARHSGAAVMVLHHTTESSNHKTVCPPRKAIQGKVNQLPRLILTLGRPQPGTLAVACVKNTNGPADPSGNTAHATLSIDPARVFISEAAPRSAAVNTYWQNMEQ